MTQKSINTFKNEFHSKRRKKIFSTNKTDVYHIDDIWTLDILDQKDYVPENNRSYRYVLVVIYNFSKFGWTVPSNKKNAQTLTNSFKKFLINSIRKPTFIESHRGKEIYNIILENLLHNNNIKHYSRSTSLVAVFAERFDRTIRDLLKKAVFELRDGNWVDILPTVTKQYKMRIHSRLSWRRFRQVQKRMNYLFTIIY